LRGKRAAITPPFSVLSTIIAPALDARGLSFHEIHHDAQKMVAAASAAHELYGLASTTLPTDLIVEAEAFGAQVDFREDMPEAMWPFVPQAPFASPEEVVSPRGDFSRRGRIPLVCDALRALKQRLGSDIVIGAWIAGPFTLANYAVDFQALLPAVKQSPGDLERALDIFAEALVATAHAYQNAGADFITIHEMGGSPGVLGPRAFAALVMPRLQRIIAALSAPTVLSVCGNTNNAIDLLAQAGASALHLDHKNDLARSRARLGNDVVLFGNLDPVAEIAHGNAATIRAAVERAANAGADAVLPGCDLYLSTRAENMRLWIEAVRGLSKEAT
jgi:[methyl-Co(III) methanol-specific corrinoid protein]:coenzyme M methyltransferase